MLAHNCGLKNKYIKNQSNEVILIKNNACYIGWLKLR